MIRVHIWQKQLLLHLNRGRNGLLREENVVIKCTSSAQRTKWKVSSSGIEPGLSRRDRAYDQLSYAPERKKLRPDKGFALEDLPCGGNDLQTGAGVPGSSTVQPVDEEYTYTPGFFSGSKDDRVPVVIVELRVS